MATISKTKCPYTGPYSVDGNGKHKGNTALALKRAMARCGHLPWEPEKWDNVFNEKLETALDKWDPGKNGYAEGRYDKIRSTMVPRGQPAYGQNALDSQCLALIAAEGKIQAPWANIGPVYNGGSSILKHDLTHATDGIRLFPAFDDAFRAGTVIIAPENIRIYRDSSARPGDACYAEGDSGLRYWFGHLVYAPPVGRTFKKSYSIGRVAYTNVGGGSHCHIGINVEKLWGVGRQLAHHTNYTHGAPLVGDQLALRYAL